MSEVHLGDAGTEVEQDRSSMRRDPTGVHTKLSVKTMPSSAARRRKGKPIARSLLAPAMRSGKLNSTASSRYTSKKSARSCIVPMWLSM